MHQELTQFPDAVSGNISKAAVPPGSKNFYWRITWKEKQKTRIRYVRPEDVPVITRGIKQFAQLKKILGQIGDINRTIILSKSKRPV
jgi:hypothetical protein